MSRLEPHAQRQPAPSAEHPPETPAERPPETSPNHDRPEADMCGQRPDDDGAPADSPSDLADDQLHDELALCLVNGVGPRLRRELLDRFGSAGAVLDAPLSQLRQVPRVGTKLAESIRRAREEARPEETLALCRRAGIQVLLAEQSGYPRLLSETPAPPGLLFVRGTLAPQDSLALAIVGTRHATHYGLRQAERLSGSLSRAGFTIVSGLARGIDGAAHRAALAAGGRTIAVLASGVLNIYPPEHRQLADDIAAQGAVISESPPLAAPRSGVFPQRNRLISGLSLGVIVVEAATRSGALITARHAYEQNRDVFAVPGPVDSRLSQGCHRLIRDGAKLVETADDVLEELGPLVEPARQATGQDVHHPAELLLNDQEQRVLDAIGREATQIDHVASQCGLPIHQVLSTLSVLEMRRMVRRVSGNAVLRPY